MNFTNQWTSIKFPIVSSSVNKLHLLETAKIYTNTPSHPSRLYRDHRDTLYRRVYGAGGVEGGGLTLNHAVDGSVGVDCIPTFLYYSRVEKGYEHEVRGV